MSACLLLIDDGREDYLERCLASAGEFLPPLDDGIIVQDTDHALGFAGAIALGWKKVIESGAEWVFHLESDFLFHEPVDVAGMIELLERRPYIAQVSLKRQAWNEQERAAGGIVEANPEDFFDCWDRELGAWLEHRRFFTTNPSVYSARLCTRGWPQEPESEGVFTHSLLEDPDLRFAYWGQRSDPPQVEHVGVSRAGHGY